VDEATACSGGEYGLVTVTVQGGSTLCTATQVTSLSSATYGNVYNDFISNQTFYINRLGNVRTFQRDGAAQTGTPQAACVSCPTTTTTTTAAPATTTTTTTTTTSAPTTTTTAAPTTTTTTLAPSGTFIVKNTSGNGQIDDVTTTGGAYFYFFNTGNFPLTTGQQADGGGASLTGADIFVDISNFSSTSCLSLYVNSGLIGQLEVSGNGTYTFTNKTFTSSDDVLIELVSGVCP
jgi:hypothetical protein